MRYLHQLKKIFVLITAAVCIAIVNFKPAGAATLAEMYLQQISQYTNSILQFLQNPANIAGMAVSLLAQDTGEDSIIAKAQQNIATAGWQDTSTQVAIKSLQPKLLADIIGKPMDYFAGKNPPVSKDLKNINDMSYSTLLGLPPSPDLPIDLYNYIKYASAANTKRPIPDSNWEGDDDAKQRYMDYYSSIVAIESYNAYIISQLAFQDSVKANETRNQLIEKASSSEWLASIATEELGKVLRQILLFESQNYVINAQLSRNQNQLAIAQALTNALLIKLNSFSELELIRSAKGKDVATTGF